MEFTNLRASNFFLPLFNSPATFKKGWWLLIPENRLKVPVGDQVLGRVLDVMGKTTTVSPAGAKCYSPNFLTKRSI